MSGHGTGEADTPIAPFTPATYVRDNVIGLAAFLLALASTVLILPALGVNSAGTLLVADVLTLIALGAAELDDETCEQTIGFALKNHEDIKEIMADDEFIRQILG